MLKIPLIDISQEGWLILQRILKKHIPNHEVWAFGSRAKWTAKEFSDLDIAIQTVTPLDPSLIAAMKEDFQESELPFKVDIVDCAAITPSFLKVIEADKVVLQEEGEGLAIKPNWKKIKISEIGKVITGKTPTTSTPDYWNGEFGFITPSDYSKSKWIKNSARRISKKALEDYKNIVLPPNSVMVTCIGSDLGKAAINSSLSITNQKINSIIVNELFFDFEFIYYCLSIRQSELKAISIGSTVPILNKTDFSNLYIQCPNLNAQKNITKILRSFDLKIAILQDQNQTLEAIAQTIFKSWFVNFDPVHAKQQGLACEGMDAETAALFPDSFVDSELGKIPQGWSIATIKEYIELAYGKALVSTERKDGIIPFYGSGGITGYHNESLVSGPAIIIGRKGTVGSLYWEDESCFPIDTVFYLKTALPLTYCFHLLQTFSLGNMNTDTAVPGLNRNNVYRLQFCIPCKELINKFNTYSKDLYKKMHSNKKKIINLTNIRDTLLPLLISGKLDISALETEHEGTL